MNYYLKEYVKKKSYERRIFPSLWIALANGGIVKKDVVV